MIEFAAETYTDNLIQEMIPLWREHHNENRQITEALDPHLAMYQALGVAGVLRIYTARRDGLLVGYQVFTVTAHPHFKERKQAVMDILYLSQESRLGWMGYKFLKFADEEIIREGVSFMFRSIDARHDFGTMLERMGYSLADLNFMRAL